MIPNLINICCTRNFCAYLLLFALSLTVIVPAHAQYKLRYNTDNLSTLTFRQKKEEGFRLSLSLVAMFTTGATDRNGIRLGGGITVSQTIDRWTFSTGFDTYKEKQNFGIGTSFAGISYDSGMYGATYYVNKYYQGDKQVSGLISAHLNDFHIRFEDDILALPFTGFKIYDRYRTAALEVRYREFMIGTNVYTSDINGVTDTSSTNSKGIYRTGHQVSSPIYVGYSRNDLIIRYGINNKLGGWIGQNGWHQYLFNTPDFKYGNQQSQFIQIGIDKQYTLY